MTTKQKSRSLPPIVPVNDETRAMLDYAASPEGRAKIERARQEIREGKGIDVTSGYFDELNRRIAQRAADEKARGASSTRRPLARKPKTSVYL